jgi:Na+/H+-dicarboxylate symporter
LLSDRNAGTYIRKVLLVFPITALSVSAIALVFGLTVQPGANLDSETLDQLGIAVNQASNFDLEVPVNGSFSLQEEADVGFTSFLFQLVPENIFYALSRGKTLQVVFFTIILGVALGRLARHMDSVGSVLQVLESVYESFKKIIAWLIVFFPFALFSLVATQAAKVGADILVAMAKFTVTVALIYTAIYFLGCFPIWQRSKASFKQVFTALEEPTILALATSNSLASMSVAIRAMTESLHFERSTTDSIIPLAITVGRFGQVTYFAIASIFVVNLYEESMSLPVIAIITFGSIFAGIASSGTTGIVTLSTLKIVLDPLSLPLEAVLILFIAIDPLMDPLRTLGSLHTGMVVSAMISEVSSEEDPDAQAIAFVYSQKVQEE